MLSPNYRPEYHFTPPTGWMNDPNGLVFYEGEYHLFYQHVPPGTEGLHWGHAVSHDLMQWTHLPVALVPDPLGDIWSGSAVVDETDSSGFFDGGAGLVAVFTHHRPDAQCQSLAYSRDRGRIWTKYAGNPVLTDPGPDFRDPKVFWYAPSRRWVMVVAAGAEARLYTSPNLRDWAFLSAVPAPQPDWIWECPDLIALDGQWVLSGSFVVPAAALSRRSETHYWRGTFDGAVFTPHTEASRLSFGPDDYAAVSWNDAPDGRKISLGWMNRWAYAGAVPTASQGFQGAMTLPRELSLRDGVLCQNPPPELAARRGAAVWFDENSPEFAGEVCEIEAEINLSALQQPEVGFELRAGGAETARVICRPGRGEICIGRAESERTAFHPEFAGEFCGPLAVHGGVLKLRIFVDRCSVEVFAQDGRSYGAALIFPGPGRRSIRFIGAGARITRGVIYVIDTKPAIN